MLLDMTQTKGVIGTELLNKYSIILSNQRKILVLQLYNDEDSFDGHHNSDEKSLPIQNKLTLAREFSLD
jgi:hypothetical protein